MAAQNKTTAVHFSLIFFVMLSVILGVVAYLYFADFREQEVGFNKMRSDVAALQGANKKYLEEIAEMKKAIGTEVPEVGVTDPTDAKSVLGQVKAVIANVARNPAAPNLVAALQDLRSQIDKQAVELAERDAAQKRVESEMAALRGQYEGTSQKHDAARMASEQDLAGVQAKNEEAILAKDKDLAAGRTQVAALQTELAQTKDQLGGQVRELEQEMGQYKAINQRLTSEIANIRGQGFEVADGEIRRIDQVSRTVWINVGAKDGLRKRTTFSVYQKNNAGIGRPGANGGRSEDIKGSIEVTRIIDNDLAEARILDDDSSNPISPGDPIYSPLWGAGRVEQFAFVGMIDMDGDKSYLGDRERLHEVAAAHGAEIATEVNDDGELVGRPIDEQLRFLVIGSIPDPSREPDDARKSQLKAMAQHQKELVDDAHRFGVQVINLNQFLDYVGYVPQQRTFLPGSGTAPFTLRSGSHSGLADRPNAAASSSGNTSALFGTRKTANPNSTGNTSQTFGGRR